MSAPLKWIPLAELARQHGVAERTLRRRLCALHEQMGGSVLRWYTKPGKKRGKLWVNPQALHLALSAPPGSIDEQLSEQAIRIEGLERDLETLVASQRRLKAELERLRAARPV